VPYRAARAVHPARHDRSTGKRAVTEDVVDSLIECHGRIRRFLVMAPQLAAAAHASPSEIESTAAQIRRYFVEGFPLHMLVH
jgi:hypothetical protein